MATKRSQNNRYTVRLPVLLCCSDITMGNRSSSVQPAGPPPLLAAAVMGDLTKFREHWTGEESLEIQDSQQNNVLHALYSCRRPGAQCVEILDRIHQSCSSITGAYQARNNLGCTPLWILVAYGNVELLKHVQTKFENKKEQNRKKRG